MWDASSTSFLRHGDGMAYATSVATSQAVEIMSRHSNGIMTYGSTIDHISGRAMFNATLQQASAWLGIAQHISSKSCNGGTMDVTLSHLLNMVLMMESAI